VNEKERKIKGSRRKLKEGKVNRTEREMKITEGK
jgi:hypothetical protein